MTDRNRLLDLSNKLRVDLQRVGTTNPALVAAAAAAPATLEEKIQEQGKFSASKQASGSRQLADQLRSVEANTAARYENKINDIEGALKALTQHNKTLRGEFGEWEERGIGNNSNNSINSINNNNNNNRSVMWQDEEQNTKLLDARRSLMKAKEDLQIGDVWGQYDIKNMGISLGGSGVGHQNLKLRILGGVSFFFQSCHLSDECHFLPSCSHGV